MNDLNGLQWTANGSDTKKGAPMSSSMFQAMRSTPQASGRSTSFGNGQSNPPSKSTTPANDSFASLVSFGSSSSTKNLSLQDQQKRLLEQRSTQQAANAKQIDAQFAGGSEQFWNNLGSGRNTPSVPVGQSGTTFGGGLSRTDDRVDEEDILAAFNSSATVDSSTHFPKPASTPVSIGVSSAANITKPPTFPTTSEFSNFDNDDDPFGLSNLKGNQRAQTVEASGDLADDDVLGLLGEPVSQVAKPQWQPEPSSPPNKDQETTHPQDKAVAELVEMGFAPEKAREALEATESGLDVPAAVGWLLNQAHDESKQRSKGRTPNDSPVPRNRDRRQSGRRLDHDDPLAWRREESRDTSSSRRREPGLTGDKDAAHLASEFGNNLFKTAGSLWKQGTKRMQQAVQEFNNSDSDTNVPKWMRDASSDSQDKSSSIRPSTERQNSHGATVTDEALMLESASHKHRETGTSYFKRGDFSAAHASYTSALTQIPTTHPITIVILTNRALTALKVGEPKTALTDANNALSVIGKSKGEAETITISTTEQPKPMRDYYGKALMRKAEALEQLEKWSEALVVWREAIDGGHGGAISQQGRTRCEKAAGASKPKPAAAALSRPAAIHKSVSAPPHRPPVSSAASDAAVSKLRAANAAAEKLDDEKFALADSVEAKITAWKGGKVDNLRALIGSLDTVLWPETGWKKVGMAELVLPNKVKIQYMKGISKVHPDKIPVTATTEQRMIAGAVFSALNEAWDKFKKENNL
ncbi:putative uba ts-n domain protein [Phaeomoniella chlamydospora]|uniref:Putative uba ts-n domain protein n=1 Tax=Phaeomoniella chlamydospora TaxID=158046 RepID=A0A0G2GL13_PHACM|nr:putative uba ts-n domain protein [Phaeomoniella chlamydospora]